MGPAFASCHCWCQPALSSATSPRRTCSGHCWWSRRRCTLCLEPWPCVPKKTCATQTTWGVYIDFETPTWASKPSYPYVVDWNSHWSSSMTRTHLARNGGGDSATATTSIQYPNTDLEGLCMSITTTYLGYAVHVQDSQRAFRRENSQFLCRKQTEGSAQLASSDRVEWDWRDLEMIEWSSKCFHQL